MAAAAGRLSAMFARGGGAIARNPKTAVAGAGAGLLGYTLLSPHGDELAGNVGSKAGGVVGSLFEGLFSGMGMFASVASMCSCSFVLILLLVMLKGD